MFHSSPSAFSGPLALDRRSVLIGAAGLLAAGAAGCSSRPTVEAAANSAAPIVVTDQRGVEVTIPGPVTRIATTVIPSPSMITAVDGSYDRIVGINESTLAANKAGLFATMFPASTSTTTVAPSSFTPNIETLTQLQPQVVFQWADRGDDLITPIEQAGFPVVGLLYGTQAHLETWISLFAQILGKPERGRELTTWMGQGATEIGTRVAGAAAVRGVHLSKSGDAFTAANSTTYTQHWMDLVGATNVAADNFTTEGVVSIEQLIAWDPEVITLGGFDELSPQELYDNSRLASIAAVRNRRVYKCPLGGYRMEVPCAESPLMWQWAAAVYHPQIGSAHLRTVLRDKENYLYGHQLTPAQVDQVLKLQVNSVSAHYTNLFA